MQRQFPDVVKGSNVGTWCQWGAIIVAVLGILQIFVLAAQNQLLPILGTLSGTIFSALILYAVGVIVKQQFGQP
jgi:uncharacterized integral membrane protein